MNNKFMLIWFIVILIIFGSILTYSVNYMKKHPFLKLEHKIKESAKNYMKDYEGIKPDKFIELTITSEELQKKDYLEELKYKNKKCSGKVVVKNENNKYKYIPNIVCDNNNA